MEKREGDVNTLDFLAAKAVHSGTCFIVSSHHNETTPAGSVIDSSKYDGMSYGAVSREDLNEFGPSRT